RYQQHFRTTPAQVRSDSQQQWTSARHYDALSSDRQSSLDECLKTTGAHHVRQRPTRKRQEPFACARRKNQTVVSQLAHVLTRFGEEDSGSRLLKYPSSRDELNLDAANFLEPRSCLRRRRLCLFSTPDLTTRGRIIVDDSYAQSILCPVIRGSQPRRSSSNDEQIGLTHQFARPCRFDRASDNSGSAVRHL